MSYNLVKLVSEIDNLVHGFVSRAQPSVSVSGGAPSEIAAAAAKPYILRLVRPIKAKSPDTLSILLTLHLGVNKKANAYDPRLSSASISIVREQFPHEDPPPYQAESQSTLAQNAAKAAMLALIKKFNSESPGKMPDPSQDPSESPIRFVPRPRQDYEMDREEILKV